MRSKKLIVSAIVFGIAFLLHVIVLLNLPISKLGTLFSLPVSSLLLCALPSALIASLVWIHYTPRKRFRKTLLGKFLTIFPIYDLYEITSPQERYFDPLYSYLPENIWHGIDDNEHRLLDDD